ncbi:centrosomal protein of 63 kDa isoform X3 [Phyllostomus discolor]|uniref:Centrosomal protein of 63 kDa n=1 Tax=Phyllostomus discolor TaxID=89673 RepID=A0A7E6E6B0_9CHIR|nr:centrosomal protein of 63 kDa isoform X3 [Phyllostomus discolor]
MCARRAGEGRACPSPEAELAAAVPLAERLYGPGLASPAARRPPGPPPPVRARSGAPPLGPAAYTQRSREGGYGLARRCAARASQTSVMSWWHNNLQSCQSKGDLAMEALLEGIQNRGRDGGFLTSCEAELQELMKQIDIMVAHKKSEWEGQTHALETCLDIREQELKTLRGQLDIKHKEVGILRQQVEELEKVKQEMAMDYKQELKKLHEELGKLKRSYEKLQKKQIKDFRGNTKNHREDRSEIERLTGKIEAQLANRKQKLESVELSRQSEIQHLSSQLERANDTICANEMEIERLTMKVNDLVGTNVTVMQEQRQKEEKLRESEKLLEVLQEEKRQLKAALHSQENVIHEANMQKEKLQAKLKATDTQHTVEAIRSPEESQTERRYSSREQDLDHVLSPLDLTHTSEELLQAEVTRLESSLESVSTTCKQLSQELMEKYEELKKVEAHNNEYRTEIKKLKEQILQADQSYSSALEGMKMEISRLTQELHQRDITIASAKTSSFDMEKRLKAEMQKAEKKAVEHKDILDQLESLKLENRRLSEMVTKLELGLHEAKEISIADLQENYIETLNKLVSENQQLQRDLMDTKSKLEISTQMCKKNHDVLLKPTHSRAPEFKKTEFNLLSRPSHGQHRRGGGKTELYKTGLSSSPRGRAPGSVEPVLRVLSPLSVHISSCSSSISLPSNFLYKTQSLPSLLDPNEAIFSDSISESINDQEEFMSSCPFPVSPLGSIATRFLEEEELRSHHILERLDAHIEELKRESEKTVKQFTALK